MDFVHGNKTYQTVPDDTNNCIGCCLSKADPTECELVNRDFDCSVFRVKWIEKEHAPSKEKDVLSKQEGGSHYKELNIEPVEYIHANELSFFEGNVVKYVTRHKNKKGAEDIRKAIHYLEMILKFEYSQDANQESK